jgi:hypothetical protein
LAGVNVRATLPQWLAAFESQTAGDATELLVALAADDACVRDLQRTHHFEIVLGDADVLVPQLWGLAMAHARGAIIVVTISACVPSKDWLAAIVRAHQTDHAAVGGVIELPHSATWVERAIHLVRYTPYLPPLAAGLVEEIAGDNGTYKRAPLTELLPAIERDGFWEPEIHRRLRASGEGLWLAPDIGVVFIGSHSIAGFSRQRFRHGRAHGRARAASRAFGYRASRALLAPLVPSVMLARALGSLRTKGRLDTPALMAAPLALWFFACWAAGEAVGLLSP